jgi:putative membrane protein
VKKHIILATGAALALSAASPLWAQSNTSQLHETMPVPPVNATGSAHADDPSATSERQAGQGLITNGKGNTALSDQDKSFLTQAAQYAQAQVAAGRLALKVSHQPKVVAYAKQAVSTGTTSLGPLQRIGKTMGVPLPETDVKANDEVQQLEAAKGTVFDGLYGQLEHNNQQQLLTLYVDEAEKGENTQLKGFAGTGKERASVMVKNAEQLNEGTIDHTNPRCTANPGAAGCP